MEENENKNDTVDQTVQPQSSSQPPTGVANGRPFYQQTAPASTGGRAGQASALPSKWRYFFIVLGVLQILGVALFFLTMSSVAGQTGSEFIALALFATLVPGVGIVALVNLLGLPMYMAKRKPRGKGLIFGVMSLIISAILVLYGSYAAYSVFVKFPNYTKEQSAQSQESERQYRQAKEGSEITKEEATTLLQTCKLKGFYYTSQTSRDDGNWGELSTTGVVLTKVSGQPYRISIADRLVAELVPVARSAQKTCGGPQSWHDGKYEQRQADGTWR